MQLQTETEFQQRRSGLEETRQQLEEAKQQIEADLAQLDEAGVNVECWEVWYRDRSNPDGIVFRTTTTKDDADKLVRDEAEKARFVWLKTRPRMIGSLATTLSAE